MWATMGPIAKREKDRLGASDLAVVEFRKLMLEAVRAFQAGSPAIGTGEHIVNPAEVCAFQAIVPKTVDWRNHVAHAVKAGENSPELEPSYSV